MYQPDARYYNPFNPNGGMINRMGYGLYDDMAYKNYGYVDPRSDEYASRTFANIIRGEYRDYQDRFVPYENRMMDLATSTQLLDEQLGRITTNINTAYDNRDKGMSALMRSRYGLAESGAQRNSNARQTELNRAMSIAHAKNNTRQNFANQQMNMVTGSNTLRNNVMQSTQGG